MAKYDIGVVVGRFQVPELHFGHKKLLELVASEAKNILVFIGVAPTLGTKDDPLDFTSRARMLQQEFPTAIVVPLMDRPSNQDWGKNLDTMIRTVFPMGTVCLYGGRDSFLRQYKGSFKTQRVEEFSDANGTDIRKDAGKTIRSSADFRAGIIYSTQNQYPRLHMTVDIAVVKGNKVLLGRKQEGGGLHFPGGFVDPSDESLELAAVRELDEETKITGFGADALRYVGSFQVTDWRYTKDERIVTALFVVNHTWGNPENTEELTDVAFYPINSSTLKLLYEPHRILWTALQNYLGHSKSKQDGTQVEDRESVGYVEEND